MKKIIILVAVLALLGGMAFAGDNQSAKYIRMIAREADTRSIDAAYFNPAGTAFLAKGFHIEADLQTVILNYSHEVVGDPFGNNPYEMNQWIPIVPAAYIGYAGGNWSAFALYNIPEGGGSVEYDKVVIPGPAEVELVASEATHAIGIGGSFAITEWISLGARFDMSIESDSYEVNGAAVGGDNEITAGGTGFGGTFGVHTIPFDGFNLSVTVETAQSIEVETKDSSGLGVAAIEPMVVSDADRPWKMRVGASYTFPFGLEIPVTFKYSFWEAVDKDVLQDTWATSFALRYWVAEGFEISLGGSYSTGNVQDDQLDSTYFNPELDSYTIAGGIGWELFENFTLDVGMLYPIYFEEDGTSFAAMNKQVLDFGLGIGYVF